jgi:hypothetical protein
MVRGRRADRVRGYLLIASLLAGIAAPAQPLPRPPRRSVSADTRAQVFYTWWLDAVRYSASCGTDTLRLGDFFRIRGPLRVLEDQDLRVEFDGVGPESVFSLYRLDARITWADGMEHTTGSAYIDQTVADRVAQLRVEGMHLKMTEQILRGTIDEINALLLRWERSQTPRPAPRLRVSGRFNPAGSLRLRRDLPAPPGSTDRPSGG